jgi:hypothetical protein
VFEALAHGSLKTEYLQVFRERQSCLLGFLFSSGVAQPGSKSETLPSSSQKGPLRRIWFRKKRFFFALRPKYPLGFVAKNAPARHSHILDWVRFCKKRHQQAGKAPQIGFVP